MCGKRTRVLLAALVLVCCGCGFAPAPDGPPGQWILDLFQGTVCIETDTDGDGTITPQELRPILEETYGQEYADQFSDEELLVLPKAWACDL